MNTKADSVNELTIKNSEPPPKSNKKPTQRRFYIDTQIDLEFKQVEKYKSNAIKTAKYTW